MAVRRESVSIRGCKARAKTNPATIVCVWANSFVIVKLNWIYISAAMVHVVVNTRFSLRWQWLGAHVRQCRAPARPQSRTIRRCLLDALWLHGAIRQMPTKRVCTALRRRTFRPQNSERAVPPFIFNSILAVLFLISFYYFLVVFVSHFSICNLTWNLRKIELLQSEMTAGNSKLPQACTSRPTVCVGKLLFIYFYYTLLCNLIERKYNDGTGETGTLSGMRRVCE